MLIVQNSLRPSAIRHAIVDLLERDVRRVRVASAYMTLEGSRVVHDAVEKCVGRNAMTAVEKVIITSFDFGLTQPAALEFWRGLPNATVYVAGADAVEQGRLFPSSTAFHPKVYAFERRSGRSNILAGSANMTGRGLSANTEVAMLLRDVAEAQVRRTFEAVREGTRPLDDTLLGLYRRLRAQQPPPPQARMEIDPLPAPTTPPLGALRLFWDEVEAGRLRPEAEEQMWIQARTLQGGSGNQLEMPRGAHRFFGLEFHRYDYPRKITIGRPVLLAGRNRWDDRILSWHGDNRMERINLPTAAQGGFQYANSAILFRRRRNDAFELVVAAWDSDLAKSWREAAAKNNRLYRVGQVTRRLAGFIR